MGERATLDPVLLPLRLEEPIDRGGTHGEQLAAHGLIDVEFTRMAEEVDQRAKERDKSLWRGCYAILASLQRKRKESWAGNCTSGSVRVPGGSPPGPTRRTMGPGAAIFPGPI